MKQIGQILVERGWVDPAQLERALAEQARTGRRICSLLILRGALDADHAARALSEQHGVPGVFQKHLEHRDLALPALLPAALARSCIALPIGRTSSGALIVCVRDPRPEVLAAITAAVSGPAVVAVALAYQLEHLVAETYPAEAPAPEGAPDGLTLELEFPSQPSAFLEDGPGPTGPTDSTDPSDDDVDVDLETRRIPVISDPLGRLGRTGSVTLVGLDDARVDKDPSQSGQHEALGARTSTGGSALPRTTTVSQEPPRTLTSSYPPRPALPRAPTHPRGTPPPTLDAAIAALEGAATQADATDAAMAYLAGRFHHAVWFAIHEGAALGERGHGDPLTAEVIQAIAVPLGAPTLLQVAHDTRRLATAAPPDAGAIQDRLWRTLGAPRTPAAMPVEVEAQVAAVIAVGDPVGEPATARHDLERLGRALGAALQRITGRRIDR